MKGMMFMFISRLILWTAWRLELWTAWKGCDRHSHQPV